MRAAAFLIAAALPAAAEPPACALSYAQFEAAVAHLDLETCPVSLEGPGRFCRVVAANRALHVFVFDVSGAQCLLETRAFGRGEFALAAR